MDAHRIKIFDGANDDAIVVLVADDFHLKLFPAQHGFFYQHRMYGRCGQAAFHQFLEFILIIGNAAAGAAHGKRRADDGRQFHHVQGDHGFFHGTDLLTARAFQPDFVHCIAEPKAVFRLVDDIGIGPDHLHIQQIQNAAPLQLQRTI